MTLGKKGLNMESIKIYRGHPFVIIDDDFGEMMNWAVRYALGRRTYAVSQTCRYIKRVLPYLDYRTLSVIVMDIKEHEDESSPFYGLGDACDVADWMSLKEAVQKRIEEMVEDAI